MGLLGRAGGRRGLEGIFDFGFVYCLLLAEARAEEGEVFDVDGLAAEEVVCLDPSGNLGKGGAVEPGEGDVGGEAAAFAVEAGAVEGGFDLGLEVVEGGVAIDADPEGGDAAGFFEGPDAAELEGEAGGAEVGEGVVEFFGAPGGEFADEAEGDVVVFGGTQRTPGRPPARRKERAGPEGSGRSIATRVS